MGDKEEARQLECMPYVDTMVYCLCPPNQTRTYYRTGKPDSCARQFDDMYLCMRLKLKMGDEKRTEALAKLKRRGEHSPTHTIWELRSEDDANEAWNK
ncbi:hypothetical protein BASA81_000398 [Batrachochytrium salamandrivorans]|nr:hypothetical protein BASA81_000398 [Batrachochytrium salamandrivorans]